MSYSYYVDSTEKLLYYSTVQPPNTVQISNRPDNSYTWDFDTEQWVENLEGKKNEARQYLEREQCRLLKFDLCEDVDVQAALATYRAALRDYYSNLTMASTPPAVPSVLEDRNYQL